MFNLSTPENEISSLESNVLAMQYTIKPINLSTLENETSSLESDVLAIGSEQCL